MASYTERKPPTISYTLWKQGYKYCITWRYKENLLRHSIFTECLTISLFARKCGSIYSHKKIISLLCRISGNSQKLSNRTYRSLIVNFAPKKEINVESRVRNVFLSRSKLWFHVGRVLQKLRFVNKFLYPYTEFYLNMTKNLIE